MLRVAAVLFSFWAAGWLAAGLLTLGVVAAPGSRSPVGTGVAFLALSAVFWHAGMGLWRPARSSAARVRRAGLVSGPLFGLAAWGVSTATQRRELLLAVSVAWLLFLVAATGLARLVDRRAGLVAPAS